VEVHSTIKFIESLKNKAFKSILSSKSFQHFFDDNGIHVNIFAPLKNLMNLIGIILKQISINQMIKLCHSPSL